MKELKVSDSVRTFEGRELKVKGLSYKSGKFFVYNFQVNDNHDYFVSSAKVLVHNACGDGGKGGVQKVGGRNPINSKYAGDTHPSGVEFTEQGFPDFTPHAKAQISSNNLTGNYAKDSAIANQAVGYPKTPKNMVWHHVEDGTTMQLIPKSIHATRHTGGAAVIRNGGN